MVTGTVGNQAAEIDNTYKVQSRQLGANDLNDDRRARAGQQLLDMAQREQNSELERAAAQDRRQERLDRERVARQDSDRIEREKRYYTCLNAAIDRYGSDRAQISCANLR